MKRLLILFASLAVLGLVAAQTLRTLSYDPDTGIVLWGGGTNALTLPASVSPSWQLLPATNGVATITTNEFGVGWDDQGRFTLSTPVGMIQMYGSGDPVQPTLYFNGTLVAQRFDAININGIVYAKNIEGGAGSPGGIISPPVVEDSFLGPFRQWTSGRSASNGVPWELTTNGFSAPIPGNYIPYVDAGVDDETGQTVKFEGRYASPEDFMEMMPMPYSGAAPQGALLQADGSGGSAFSTAATNLSEIKVGSNFAVSSNGNLLMSSNTNNIILRLGNGTQAINVAYGGSGYTTIFSGGLSVGPSALDNNPYIWREDNTMWGFRRYNATNAQSVRVYGWWTNTNNWARLNVIGNPTGVMEIKPESSGSGPAAVLHISGLPTNNPGAGILWNSNGAVMVGE